MIYVMCYHDLGKGRVLVFLAGKQRHRWEVGSQAIAPIIMIPDRRRMWFGLRGMRRLLTDAEGAVSVSP